MSKHENIYIVTDGCMWEQNKKNSTYYPHAIEVVNPETGQVQYIKSGSRIAFLEGEITNTRSQEDYNKIPASSEVPSSSQDKLQRTDSKKRGRKNVEKTTVKNKSI